MLASRQLECTPPPSPKHNPASSTATRTPLAYVYNSNVHMNTAKNLTLKDFKMHGARSGLTPGLPITDNNTLNDVRMGTAKGGGTTVKAGLKLWELELIESPEVRRKATVAQLCVNSY